MGRLLLCKNKCIEKSYISTEFQDLITNLPGMINRLINKMKILFLFILIHFSISLLAQQPQKEVLSFSPEESLIKHNSMAEKQSRFIQDLYQSVMSQSNEILNGREYKIYFYPQVSSPLIPENPQPTGSIVIQKKKYENIMLLYDTYKDLVVYYDPNNQINNSICPIVINKYLIDEFSLQLPSDQLTFKYLEFPGDLHGKLTSGFYEIVYDADCKFFIKHTSSLAIKEGRYTYPYQTERYIENGGTYYRIKGKKSFLKAFADKSIEVKRYIRNSKIPVRSAKKDQIENILKYYTSLLLQ